jgi:uncharacterized protein (TIGR00255 family)
MPLYSMTGFARADGAGAIHRWTWEVRSVNGKGLDIRLRLPAGFEHLELPARERIGGSLARGNVQAVLTTQSQPGAARIRVNDDVLAEVLAAMDRIGSRMNVQPPTLDGILSVKGVVETVEAEQDEQIRADLAAAMLSDLDAALAALVADRVREGGAISVVLRGRLDEVERLVRAVEASPARTPDAIRTRLAEQIAILLDAAPALDPDRLHQEAVLLATRADVREEIDRLDAHIAAARDLLDDGGPVGRRLDFLAQEFNREVNTLCSKSNDRAVTAIGLQLKAVVDQFREQIQNVE